MTGDWLLVHNPRAGGNDELAVLDLAERLGGVETVAAGAPDDLTATLERLGGRGLAVAGGDGSVHHAVQRLRAAGALRDTPVGIIPLGTGNDLAGSLGIPEDPARAAEVLTAGRLRTLDLIVASDGQVCVNALHAGVGVDAAERAGELKDALGALAYPLAAAIAAVDADGLEVEITVDGEAVPTEQGTATLMVVIANAATIGGGTAAAPAAQPDDGVLDVVVSRAVAPARRAAFGAALARGEHAERPDVAAVQGRSVTVAGEPLTYTVDGELGARPAASRTFRLEAATWRVAVPPA